MKNIIDFSGQTMSSFHSVGGESVYHFLNRLFLVFVFCGVVLFAPQSGLAEDYIFLNQGPTFTVSTNGLDATLSWTAVSGATGYRLYFAPYPYNGPSTLASIDLGSITGQTYTLFDGASYIAAIKAYNENGESGYSNVELVQTFSPNITCELSKNVAHQSVTPSQLSGLMSADGLNQTLTGPYVYRVVVNAGGGYYTSTSMQMCLSSEPQSGWALGTSDATEVQRTQIGDDSSLQNLLKFNNLGWQNVSSVTKSNDLYMRLDSKWGSNIDTYITYWFETDQPINQLGYKLLDEYSDDFGSITIQGYELTGEAPEIKALSSAYIQWRTYEDSNLNKIRGWFSLPKGMTSEDVSDIWLENSQGAKILSFLSFSFSSDNYLIYDCIETGACTSNISIENGYSINLPIDTQEGTYTYVLKDFSGEVYEKSVVFQGQKTLPVVDSSSIIPNWNPDGSLTIEWAYLSWVDAQENDQIRVNIAAGTGTSTIIVKLVPWQPSTITIPSTVIGSIFNKIDKSWIKVHIQTRAFDDSGSNYARGISNMVELRPVIYPIKFTPINVVGTAVNNHRLADAFAAVDFLTIASDVTSNPQEVTFTYETRTDFQNASTGKPGEDFTLGMWFDRNGNDELDYEIDGWSTDRLLYISQNLSARFAGCNVPLSYTATQDGNFVSVSIPWADLETCGINPNTPVRFWGHYEYEATGRTSQFPNVY